MRKFLLIADNLRDAPEGVPARLFDNLQAARAACHPGDNRFVALPVTRGLRLALLTHAGWVPVRVERLLPDERMVVRLYRAAMRHDGHRVILRLPEVALSLDFLAAEEEQSEVARITAQQTGEPQFYRGRLFVRTVDGGVMWLERDSLIEIGDGQNRAQWLVKDLLPGRREVVLRETTERNWFTPTVTRRVHAGGGTLAEAKVIESPAFRFAPETPHERHNGYWRIPLVWAQQMLSNTKGILSVLDMIMFRPVPGGLLPEGHPWSTGIDPDTGRHVWPDNVIFAAPRKAQFEGDARHQPDADSVILTKVGNYLAGMVKKSVSTLEHPFGSPSRMPAAINYIHGSVHYNAGIILFNDFEEGVFYLSDPRFVDEMQRFARETRREIIIVFRERVYEARSYAYFAGMIRSVLPWFSNTNGPVRGRTAENADDPFLVDGKVMWGNPAPYPVVNPITGNWIADVRAVAAANGDPARLRALCRTPIGPGQFFREHYQGSRQHAQRMERLLAIGTAKRVRARGDNLFFVDQAALDKERELTRRTRFDYVQLPAGHYRRQVVVIGAGPAGLAVAVQLKKLGVDVLVLEKGDAVGDSWLHMPANLALLTRWQLNELPDTPESIRPTETFVDARRFARYLENYAAIHGLTVAKQASVLQVETALPGGVSVKLASGAVIDALEVVNATGYFGNPFTPEAAGSDSSSIARMHFAQYSSPAQVAEMLGGTGKRVLIVGRGLSAGQAMVELEKAGFVVELSARGGKVQFGPSPRWGAWLQRILPLMERLRGWFGRSKRAPQIRMQGGRARGLIESGCVPVWDEIQRFDGRHAVFVDGSREAYDLILYCTGFRPKLAHLSCVSLDEETGLPQMTDMESDDVPFLHFIGLDGQRTARSRFLRGIREDAVALARKLAARLTAEQ